MRTMLSCRWRTSFESRQASRTWMAGRGRAVWQAHVEHGRVCGVILQEPGVRAAVNELRACRARRFLAAGEHGDPFDRKVIRNTYQWRRMTPNSSSLASRRSGNPLPRQSLDARFKNQLVRVRVGGLRAATRQQLSAMPTESNRLSISDLRLRSAGIERSGPKTGAVSGQV
jgi:hypothetical protein